MKLRLALGVGALALLIVGLVAWGGSTQRSIEGTLVAVGAEGLPAFAARADDAVAMLLCTPQGSWPARGRELNGAVIVHVLPFTRVLDARGRFLAAASRVEDLRAGQRVVIWTTETTVKTWPPQVEAVKVEIAGAVDQPIAPCRWEERQSP